MPPLEEYELGRMLGEIQARLGAMSDILENWDRRCRMCSDRVDTRLSKCETAQTRITTVGGTVGFLAGMVSPWLKDLIFGGGK